MVKQSVNKELQKPEKEVKEKKGGKKYTGKSGSKTPKLTDSEIVDSVAVKTAPLPVVTAGASGSVKKSAQSVSDPLEQILSAIADLDKRQKDHEDKVNAMFGYPGVVCPGDEVVDEEYDETFPFPDGQYHEQADDNFACNDNLQEMPLLASNQELGMTAGQSSINKPEISHSLSEMAKKYQKTEVCSHDLDESLAESINSIFREGLGDESLQSISKDITRPENCPALCTVKVNELIWKIISPQAQARDRSLQSVQTHLIKGSTLLAQMVEKVNKMKDGEDRKNLLETGLDALALFGHTNRQLINRRREILRPEIQHDYGHLCSSSVPFTDKLFGDNVSQNVKEIQDIKRVERVITRKYRGRPQPYPTYPSRGRGQSYQYGSNQAPQFYQPRGKFFPRGRGFHRGRNPNWQRGQSTVTRPFQKKPE